MVVLLCLVALGGLPTAGCQENQFGTKLGTIKPGFGQASTTTTTMQPLLQPSLIVTISKRQGKQQQQRKGHSSFIVCKKTFLIGLFFTGGEQQQQLFSAALFFPPFHSEKVPNSQGRKMLLKKRLLVQSDSRNFYEKPSFFFSFIQVGNQMPFFSRSKIRWFFLVLKSSQTELLGLLPQPTLNHDGHQHS